jgi:hypothetical protein
MAAPGVAKQHPIGTRTDDLGLCEGSQRFESRQSLGFIFKARDNVLQAERGQHFQYMAP